MFAVVVIFLISKCDWKCLLLRVKEILQSNFLVLLLFLFTLQLFVNGVGVLIPETAFDSLWYHLTLPKLYLMHEEISFIPGGLFYYSAMPKLIEMLYIPMLQLWSETGAKLIQLFFGIGTAYVLFRISRLFMDMKYALLVVVLFYSNLVVAWESTTAYIDLGRAFYESLALFALVLWLREKEWKKLVLIGVMMGFAISVKYLALTTFLIILIVIVTAEIQKRVPMRQVLWTTSLYILPALIIPGPWFVFAYIATGNPLYPSFTTDINAITFSWTQFYPQNLISTIWNILMKSPDPLSPVYAIALPLSYFVYKKSKYETKLIFLFACNFITCTTPANRWREIYSTLPCIIFLYCRINTYSV
jgi:hypothetical protein